MSCWSNPKPETRHTPETLDDVLLDYSEGRFQAEIAILAGSTSGVLELIGIEDDLNFPGEEEDICLVICSPQIYF